MWNDQLYIYYCNLHDIPSLTTPTVSCILMSTDNTASSKHNYDELLNIPQYFPNYIIVLYATKYRTLWSFRDTISLWFAEF